MEESRRKGKAIKEEVGKGREKEGERGREQAAATERENSSCSHRRRTQRRDKGPNRSRLRRAPLRKGNEGVSFAVARWDGQVLNGLLTRRPDL